MGDSIGLTAEEVLTTTRSVRKRLDLERPVSRETIMECIEIAHQAPTGSNNQGWSWVVIDDPDKKLAIAEHYRAIYWPYRELADENRTEEENAEPQRIRISASADHLADNFEHVPAMVIPLHAGRLEDANSFRQAGAWGSILPAVWSFMMALRSKGMGSAWTTLHLPREREVAEICGIDYDNWTQAGLFPVAYTLGTDFKLASRKPAEQFVHFNRW